MSLTSQQKQEYIKTGGVRCPTCGSYHIETGRLEMGEQVYQGCSCQCGQTWVELYTLTDIEEEDYARMEVVS